MSADLRAVVKRFQFMVWCHRPKRILINQTLDCCRFSWFLMPVSLIGCEWPSISVRACAGACAFAGTMDTPAPFLSWENRNLSVQNQWVKTPTHSRHLLMNTSPLIRSQKYFWFSIACFKPNVNSNRVFEIWWAVHEHPKLNGKWIKTLKVSVTSLSSPLLFVIPRLSFKPIARGTIKQPVINKAKNEEQYFWYEDVSAHPHTIQWTTTPKLHRVKRRLLRWSGLWLLLVFANKNHYHFKTVCTRTISIEPQKQR